MLGSFLSLLLGLFLLFLGAIGALGGFLRQDGWEFVIGVVLLWGGTVMIKLYNMFRVENGDGNKGL